MRKPAQHPATASDERPTASADATQPRPGGGAVSPATGPVPAIYVQQPPSQASTPEPLWHATAGAPLWILHVETNLGLRPGGVERLGEVLLGLGLAERVGAQVAGRLRAPAFDERRDPVLGARNVRAAAALAIEQADRVGEILDHSGFPVVLGGDDSTLFGCLLALRRRGPAGLVSWTRTPTTGTCRTGLASCPTATCGS